MSQGVFTISTRVDVQGIGGLTENLPTVTERAACGAGTNGIIQSVTLTASTYTSFTIPASAKQVIITIPAGAKSLTLKGNTSDTGVSLIGSTPSPQNLVVKLPVSSPTLGIANGDGAVAPVVELRWY